MSRPIAHARWFWWMSALLCVSSAAVADDDWATHAAECFRTLDGFNEDRQWAHYLVTRDEVRVLVQSGGEDWVFVELACGFDGGIAEGPRRTLPQRVTGTGTVPPSMLARDELGAARLERLARRARDHADLDDYDLAAFEASYLHEPEPRVLYRATFSRDGEERSVEFDDRGVVEGPLALRQDELSDAPEPTTPGAALGLERLTDDPAKVVSYLAGRLGASTRINRFIIDPSMLTVEWVSRDEGRIVLGQWMIIDGRLTDTGDPMPPNMDKACANPPSLSAVGESLARAMAPSPRARRIRQSAMLLLECESAGTAAAWNLLGGDGKLEAGVPLSQERFGFQ